MRVYAILCITLPIYLPFPWVSAMFCVTFWALITDSADRTPFQYFYEFSPAQIYQAPEQPIEFLFELAFCKQFRDVKCFKQWKKQNQITI